MPNITIDGKEYDVDSLPKEAKDQIASLQFVEAEFKRLNAQIAVVMTARAAYSKALNDILNAPKEAAKLS
jgi:hypothetical protein